MGRKGKMRREWQSTPVFFPGEFHGQRSLAGHSPRGLKEADMSEQLTHAGGKMKCYLLSTEHAGESESVNRSVVSDSLWPFGL